MKRVRNFGMAVALSVGALGLSQTVSANPLGTGEVFRSSFEEDMGWPTFTGNGASVQRFETEAYEGEFALLVGSRGAHWNGARLVLTDRVVPSGRYAFSAQVKGLEPAVVQMTLQIVATNGSTTWHTIDASHTDNEWVELSGEWLAAEAINTVFLHFETSQQYASGERFLIDNVLIEALDGTKIPELDLRNPEAGLAESLSLPSLHERWAPYFTLGNIFTPHTPFDGRHDLLTHHFGHQITAENLMKPDAMQPRRGEFNFGPAWDMVHYAQEQGMQVVGHALVWHEQSLPWLTPELEETLSREEAIDIMQNHIQTVMEEFLTRDKEGNVIHREIFAWDVVNEAIVPASGSLQDWRNHLRPTKWYRMIGDDYLEIAFRYAHEVDPGAILYYNDYNEDVLAKSTIIRHMVDELRSQGVPIHRVGLQGHYNQNTNINTLQQVIDMYRDVALLDGQPLELSITELDITIAGAEQELVMPERTARLQAMMYAQLFQLLRDNSDIIQRVTFWGMDDPHSWRSTQHPNLFNADLSPKPAFFAVLDPDGFLASMGNLNYAQELELEGLFGTPSLELWEQASPIRISNNQQAWNFPGATARLLWDRENIYLLIDVVDNAVDAELSNVEVLLAQDFVTIDDIAWRETVDGYQVEMRIPLEGLSTEATFPIDFRINYYRDGEHRGSVVWGNADADSESWGEAVLLVGDNLEAYEASQPDDVEFILIGAVVAGIFAIGVVASRLRRKK